MQYIIEVQFVATNPVADCEEAKYRKNLRAISEIEGRADSRFSAFLRYVFPRSSVLSSLIQLCESGRGQRENAAKQQRQKRKLTHSFLQSRYYHISFQHVSSPYLWNERHGLTA